jgi:hypothetical protein
MAGRFVSSVAEKLIRSAGLQEKEKASRRAFNKFWVSPDKLPRLTV